MCVCRRSFASVKLRWKMGNLDSSYARSLFSYNRGHTSRLAQQNSVIDFWSMTFHAILIFMLNMLNFFGLWFVAFTVRWITVNAEEYLWNLKKNNDLRFFLKNLKWPSVRFLGQSFMALREVRFGLHHCIVSFEMMFFFFQFLQWNLPFELFFFFFLIGIECMKFLCRLV